MRLSVKKATVDSVSRRLQKYLDMTNILQYPEEEFARFDFLVCGPYAWLLVADVVYGYFRVANGLAKASTEGLLRFHWLPPVK